MVIFSYSRLVVIAVFLFLACGVSAQIVDQDALDSLVRIGERPDAAKGPTKVSISLHVLDVFGVDEVKQNYLADLFALAEWHDSRLALPEAERLGRIRTVDQATIWTPRVLVLNDRGLDMQLPTVANVDDLGNVRYQQRLSGMLAAQFEFKEFPFDSQIVSVDLISYLYSPEEVVFELDASMTGEADKFSAKGWKFSLLASEAALYEVPSVGVQRPMISYRMEAKRISEYHLLTMFLPMALIVFMAWAAFWIQPELVPPRIAISTASIFSLIALGFSVRLGLPQVSYLTRADMFVLGCTLLVFSALGVAVLGSRWASSERLEKAVRLNAYVRWVYALSFGIVILLALYL